jgi:DNA-binding NarL/FixJ family response regulator
MLSSEETGLRSFGDQRAGGVNVGRRVALLAVQDDERREALAGFLRDEDLAIVELEDGWEVKDYLELALGSGAVLDAPSVIVCDVTLEGRSGIEILLDLRGSGAAIPVLLVHDEAESALVEDAERLGATALLHGRLDHDEWADAIDLLS